MLINCASVQPQTSHADITQADNQRSHCIITACNLDLFMELQAKDAKVSMVIRVLDTHKHEWSIMSPAGNAPPQRGGHSVGALALHFQHGCHRPSQQ